MRARMLAGERAQELVRFRPGQRITQSERVRRHGLQACEALFGIVSAQKLTGWESKAKHLRLQPLTCHPSASVLMGGAAGGEENVRICR